MVLRVENTKKLAELFATHARLRIKSHRDSEKSLQYLKELAETLAIEPLEPKAGKTVSGCLQRYSLANWWRRRLESLSSQGLEQYLRSKGQVSAQTGKHVSNSTFERFLWAQSESQKYLQRTKLESQDGEELFLSEVFEHSVANPAVRRSEMMARIRGMEEYANVHDYESVFLTLTLPSRFHASLKAGYRNSKYDGSTPKDGNNHLQKLWSLIRSKYGRDGMRPFGIRVVEPHHDGTPHWHLLLFVKPAHKEQIVNVFKGYVRNDSASQGELKRRLDVTYIDSSKGSAAGYVAKYVAKNIDGAHLETDKEGAPCSNASARIRAWASTWKVRQFQFLGSPPVSVWRELRRLTNGSGLIEEARQAADSGNWSAFMEAMAKPQLVGTGVGVELMFAHAETVNKITGEVVSTETNSFGEPGQPKVIGVMSGILRNRTRIKHWLGKHYEPLTLLGLVRGAHIANCGNGSIAAEGSALGLV
ncbi:replication endonuclease [Reinekea marinisedimentorum]|uniref:Bacteriophage replication gene A protein n=1 Tax=Reinekea marinisedimentorum TaxID=230495 RepID=A0A4R3I5Y3_9GAMM|nr:replication endonuclease [Reinekea marinisedimentorum]TCS40409.1 bacteriophage replication gene A protein [Reinekea marinisedimentorum]